MATHTQTLRSSPDHELDPLLMILADEVAQQLLADTDEQDERDAESVKKNREVGR